MLAKPSKDILVFLHAVQSFYSYLDPRGMPAAAQVKLGWLLSAILFNGAMSMEANAAICLHQITGRALCYFLKRSGKLLATLWRASILYFLANLPVQNIDSYILIDDTDLSKSKTIKRIFGVFKAKDKASGGFKNAQRIVVVLMLVRGVRIPLFFCFHRPDPRLTKWHRQHRENKKAEKKGKRKPHNLGPKPPRRQKYPTQIQIALKLLGRTKTLIAQIEKNTDKKIKIRAITFDAAFMSGAAYKQTKRLFPSVQVISQIKSNQQVSLTEGSYQDVAKFFANKKFIEQKVSLREEEKTVQYASYQLFVKALGAKVHVVALKYKGETTPRYLVATQRTWRAKDIITAYSSRWIIEVLFEDLKQNCALGRRACLQQGSGSYVTVSLSMIVDIYCQSKPEQLERLRNGMPVLTTGSIARSQRTDAILETLEEFVSSDNPRATLDSIKDSLKHMQKARPSKASILSESFFNLGPSHERPPDQKHARI